MLRGDVQGGDIGDLAQRLAAVSQKSMQCGDHLRTLAHGGGDALDRSRTHVADREYPSAAGFERKSIAARRVAGQNEPLRVQGNGRAAQPMAIMSLANGPLDVVSDPDRPARETDAEEAIEITPEMIEAGLSVMWNYEDFVFEDKRRAASVDIFRAMERAHRKFRL